jgi:hypothetical protein
MEHNNNKIFQDKIKEAEQKPLPWKKDLVWEDLSSKLSGSSNSYKKYYWIAASLLLGTSIGFSLLNWESKLNTLRLSRLAESIYKLEQNQGRVKNENSVTEDCVQEDNNISKIEEPRKLKKEKSIKDNFTAVTGIRLDSTTSITKTAFEEFEVEHEVINDLQPEVAGVPPLKHNKIEAIIGTVPESTVVITSSTKPTKLRVRIFKSADDKKFENHIKENQFIIARIK